MKTVVMSLGGSLIAPDGVDIKFLKKFRDLILDFTAKGNRVIIITGGGNTARVYQAAAKKIFPKVKADDLDWIGIAATKINGELVSAIFGDKARESIIIDPTRKFEPKRRIIVGAGYKPGHSSDMDAVWLAKGFNAKQVINLSNIEYVYDKDPSKHKDAKKIKEMSWKEFRKQFGSKWFPGAHAPFDPVAAKHADKWGIDVIVAKGSNIANLKKILNGKNFAGTVIK